MTQEISTLDRLMFIAEALIRFFLAIGLVSGILLIFGRKPKDWI